MKKRAMLPSLIATGALILTACGDTDEPSQEGTIGDAPTDVAPDEGQAAAQPPTVEVGEEAWFITENNSVGKFTIPGEPVAEYEELRESVDADEVTYITVTVDNREGMEGVNMYDLSAYDEDGREYSFTDVGDALDEWRDLVGDDTEHYNRFIDAGNESMTYADPGQVAEFVMVSEKTDLPDEFTRVGIQAHGASQPVEAHPESDSEGVDLDFEAPE